MQVDQTTINDLLLFSPNENESVFGKFNFTQTNGGKFFLQQLLSSPLQSIEDIKNAQHTFRFLEEIKDQIPQRISNGTIMVLERFYDTAIDSYPANCNLFNSFCYSIFSKADYSLSKYSLQHFIQFLKGINKIEQLLEKGKTKTINFWREKISFYCNKAEIKKITAVADVKNLSPNQILTYISFIKNHFKQDCFELIDVYCKIDAYLSVANAAQINGYTYPEFIEKKEPQIQIESLHHILLNNPVSYNINLNNDANFLFLTGANMAGKSTFIKAVGIAVYLAHLGFPVPAKQVKLSFFDGLLSNINITDNIFKNESYFFNEVKRIKSTVEKVADGKNWLILIDELFKGTNIQDAMKCSTTVIDGLQKKRNALFILSTHLYEISENLNHANIQFKYFETSVINNNLYFSYLLKDGVSKDKLGYLILEKEGVTKLLQ